MAYILLIEPDRRLAKNYLSLLQEAGHEVEWCTDGQLAIQAADARQPEVVILELQLKGHNGVEFLYEFRSYPEWQSVPVIAQTMVPPAALDNIATAHLLDIHTYLYKPTSRLSALLEAIKESLAASADVSMTSSLS